MPTYSIIRNNLAKNPKTWLITGVAGFIGSNILEELLKLDQKVIGLDNFSTGNELNLKEVKESIRKKQWSNFEFFEGDISIYQDCKKVFKNIDYVLHQAALGSVPRSLEDPIQTNISNVVGFLNILDLSKIHEVRSFTYAASSSTYGDSVELPKVEENIGSPLSPYAVTKLVNELYAETFSRNYEFHSVGLRYFNVFGKRQDPNGAYAAVIPKWISSMIKNEDVYINGDGSTSRDFSYVSNIIQANILSAIYGESLNKANNSKLPRIFNIAVGGNTSLLQLYKLLQKNLMEDFSHLKGSKPIYRDFRKGDVLHSQADITRARKFLGYDPSHGIDEGLRESKDWYIKSLDGISK